MWAYGLYLQGGYNKGENRANVKVRHIISDDFYYDVDPDTIGQFTGLVDKNGKEIYEGDILQWGYGEYKVKHEVVFQNGAFGYFYGDGISFVPYAGNTNFDFARFGKDDSFEVIGNIHDNPELLEEGGDK